MANDQEEGRYYAVPPCICPPTCKKCRSNANIEILDRPDSWTYYCVKCRREIDAEEFM